MGQVIGCKYLSLTVICRLWVSFAVISGHSACYRVVTVGYSWLQQVTKWLPWVTTGYSMLPSGYSGLQQVTTSYRVVTVGYSRLQQVTASYQVVTVGYSRLQEVIEWLQ